MIIFLAVKKRGTYVYLEYAREYRYGQCLYLGVEANPIGLTQFQKKNHLGLWPRGIINPFGLATGLNLYSDRIYLIYNLFKYTIYSLN